MAPRFGSNSFGMNSAPGLPFFDVGALAVNCQGAGQPDGSGME